jgi:hypothetical protein
VKRNAFFDIINARSEAHREEISYDNAITEAAKTCNAMIDGRELDPLNMIGHTVADVLRYGCKCIIKFTGGQWCSITADEHRSSYDEGEGLFYNERLNYDDAYKLGILTEEAYGDWRKACEAKDNRQKNVRGMAALQEAMVCLGPARIKELV